MSGQISLEQWVPKDHLVRRLAGVLDLGWVRSATARPAGIQDAMGCD